MAPKPPTSKPKSSGPKSSGPKSSSAAIKKPKSKAAAHRKPSTHTPLGVTKAVPAHKRSQRPLNEHEIRELEKSLPVLNTVVPASAATRRGKAGGTGKKGKTFIDDHDKNTLLRMVEKAAMGKEGEVESKLEKARRLEAIREARKQEDEEKRKRREEIKKMKRGGKKAEAKAAAEDSGASKKKSDKSTKKKVSFA